MAQKRAGCHVTVREMGVNDIATVYRIGNQLFKTQENSTLYRIWNAYEVTSNFNNDPHLSLVAESPKGKIEGFALGTTYENELGGWKYGYILWIGVRPRCQRSHIASQLYHEMERRMHREGVRMAFIDTAKSNTGALRFFKRMGYGRPEAEVWMSKVIYRARKSRGSKKGASSHARRRFGRLRPRHRNGKSNR